MQKPGPAKNGNPAPQGRGHRIRKRSNHVTIIVDTMVGKVESTDVKSGNDNKEA